MFFFLPDDGLAQEVKQEDQTGVPEHNSPKILLEPTMLTPQGPIYDPVQYTQTPITTSSEEGEIKNEVREDFPLLLPSAFEQSDIPPVALFNDTSDDEDEWHNMINNALSNVTSLNDDRQAKRRRRMVCILPECQV